MTCSLCYTTAPGPRWIDKYNTVYCTRCIRALHTYTCGIRRLAPDPVNVCMLCAHVIADDHRPAGRFIPLGAVVSHGICLDCAPAYCKEQGLSESETARIINPHLQVGASETKNPETASAVYLR